MTIKHTITIELELTDELGPARSLQRAATIADDVEEFILDRYAPDNSPTSTEAPYRFDRQPGPYVLKARIGHARTAAAA